MTAIQIVMMIVTELDQAIPTVMKQDIQTIIVEMVTIIGTQCMKPVWETAITEVNIFFNFISTAIYFTEL